MGARKCGSGDLWSGRIRDRPDASIHVRQPCRRQSPRQDRPSGSRPRARLARWPKTQKSGRTQRPGSTASRICGIRQLTAADHSIKTNRGGRASVTARGSRQVETSASDRAGSRLRRDEPQERCRRVRSRVTDAGEARSADRQTAVEHRQVDVPMHGRRLRQRSTWPGRNGRTGVASTMRKTVAASMHVSAPAGDLPG